jgi:hypothetical protein
MLPPDRRFCGVSGLHRPRVMAIHLDELSWRQISGRVTNAVSDMTIGTAIVLVHAALARRGASPRTTPPREPPRHAST